MNRRQFSLGALGVFVTSAITGLGGPRGSIEDQIRDLFSEPRHAEEIGRRYLATHPDDANRDRLLAHALDGYAESSHGTLRPYVWVKQQRDFGSGATVLLDGWILTRTEVSLCALLAMS